MGMSMRITDADNDFNKAMQTIIVDSNLVAQETTKELANVVKTCVVSRLNAVRYNPLDDKKRPRIKHMADDVQIRNKKDKLGYPVTKIQGGKDTGTLWHIVNDGNYGHTGNHFMDNAMNDAENKFDKVIDECMRKAGF